VSMSVKNDASVTVCQSKLAFWWIQYLKWSVAIGNGIVPANPPKEAPRSRPYQARSPPASRGPSQILFTARASAGVRQFGSDDGPPLAVQTNALALYVHARASRTRPSAIPSRPSHAAVAAFATALSLADAMGAPTSSFIATAGHSSAVMNRSQLYAFAPARIPSKSPGKFCA